MTSVIERPEWQALIKHHNEIKNKHMRDWFMVEPDRFKAFSLEQSGILLDYSRNRITKATMNLLANLAGSVNLKDKITALFNGDEVNITEKRPALHTALRDLTNTQLTVDSRNVLADIAEMRLHMRQIVNKIHCGEWVGMTGKRIKYIVNVGIGGSHLGPKMCVDALREYAVSDLKFHFISSVDKTDLSEVIKQVALDETVFIISSKTFSTIETLTNAESIAQLLKKQLGPEALAKHTIAITVAKEKAQAFGVSPENILPLWNWVGGRYSVWSAIGLPLMLMLGTEQFESFLQGAHDIDLHFQAAPFEQNIPVILALLGIWYMNFFDTGAQAIIPYSVRLRYLISYLQQVEMESNGKSIGAQGQPLSYATGPVIFGEEGCNGQHAYHQLLLQSKKLIPVDFILVGSREKDIHQDVLFASGLSQAQALMRGKTHAEAKQELGDLPQTLLDLDQLASHRVIPGNRPSNVLFLEQLDPYHLGALIALYEHKIFVQGSIWGINSFDQFGVELGKQLLPDILQQVQTDAEGSGLDAATAGLIAHAKSKRELV